MATAKLTVPILLEWKDIEAYMAQHDIVEVVRCKDCALWNDGKCNTWSNLGVTILTAETGYCNFGERRDDGL